VGIAVVGDFLVVALSNPGIFGFYVSVPQIWLRFALIFVLICLTGVFITESSERKFSLWTILIAFFVVLLIMAEISNVTKGANADLWILPIIMAVFGLIGAVIGGVLGGIIGLIGKLFKKNIFILSLKYGAALGFMLLLAFWYLGCLRHGSAVCLPQ
jgi:hypothetical protein